MVEYLGDVVERKYEEGLQGLGGKLLGGVKQVASSGFGKGALITAGVIVGGAALLFGVGAGAGMLTVGHTAVHATIGTGLKFGLSYATHLLTSIVGLGALTIGGAIGVLAQPKKISVGQAQAMAAIYERHREPEMGMANNVAENKWQMAELQRRAQNENHEGRA